MLTHEESNEQSKLTRLKARLKTRTALVATATVAVLAVAGTTFGYAAMSKSVTLSVDGQSEQDLGLPL